MSVVGTLNYFEPDFQYTG